MSLQYAHGVIKNKRDLHEALDRLGFKLMSIKCAGCTVDYLKKVRTGEYWCPKYIDVKLRSCYLPPKKEKVFKEIILHTNHLQFNFGLSDATKSSLDWFLLCLSTLNPEHRYFSPSYHPDEENRS